MPTIHLVLDWDGTLTTRDTLHLVSNIGFRRNTLDVSWSDIVQAYLDDYAAHEQAYKYPKRNRRTVADESTWLASLDAVESRSMRRVEEAGIFGGVEEDDVVKAGSDAVINGEIEMRNGWISLLFHGFGVQPLEARSINVVPSILSVNWSGLFIRSCLSRLIMGDAVDGLQPNPRISMIRNLPIHANEIHEGASKHRHEIRTSKDKLSSLQELQSSRDGLKSQNSQEEVEMPLLIYVGDSATDFDALLFADVGICVRDEPMGSSQKELAETFERVGINTLPLEGLRWDPAVTRQEQKTVWWTRNLDHVAGLISQITDRLQ
jgi:2-hydroxy-3-keto-5-methylthiopentenyl-1-phosphate phosphatase